MEQESGPVKGPEEAAPVGLEVLAMLNLMNRGQIEALLSEEESIDTDAHGQGVH